MTDDQTAVTECPDPRCGIPFYARDELVTHLQHDHNHSTFEAERIVDRVLDN